ncbi:MAG: hypothetical protein ABI378_00820 [Chitinophagaceae bacterium]
MKRVCLIFGIILCSQIVFAQLDSAQTKLENRYKVEFGIQGISVGTEIPLNDRFLADVNLGWGGVPDLWHNGLTYDWSKNCNSFFARGQVRYYLNRERRKKKGHSLKNNAGTFIAYQTKFLFSGTDYYSPKVGKSWLNEIQFGQQLPLGNHFIFRYYGGIGNGYDLDYKNSEFYPALGFAFGYTF